MVVIRNVFRLKFGKAREAVGCSRRVSPSRNGIGAGTEFSSRLLTDVTGPFYTVVLELTVPSLSKFEAEGPRFMVTRIGRRTIRKSRRLSRSPGREVFTLIE